MSDDAETGDDDFEKRGGVEASVATRPQFSPVWFVPVVAAIIGMWMVYSHYVGLGPIIEVHFDNAEGIEAGTSKVKRGNVEIGEVLGVELSEDADSVLMSIRIQKQAAHLLREDTAFWIVRPRIGPGGITGLGTLFSGSYIEIGPGVSEETATVFDGLERPPVTPIGTPGLHVTLDSQSAKALTEGDPILFDGRQVGTIEYVHFNSQERRTYYNAFIEEPYDRLITTNTQFWFSSGMSIDLSADGLRVDIAALSTLIAGGVSFGVPDGQPLGDRIEKRAFFTIRDRESDIYEKVYKQKLEYVVLFDESIRGLTVGAPVEYRGVHVGEVLRTDVEYDDLVNLLDEDARIPVLIEIVPANFGFEDTEEALAVAEATLEEFFRQGLHGTLGTGNLLTGRKLIMLEFSDDDPPIAEYFAGYRVFPSRPGQLGRLIENVAITIDKINQLPLNDLVSSATRALEELEQTLAEVDSILETESSHAVMGSLNNALLGVRELADGFVEGSETHEDLQRALQSLQRTLDELEPALRNLRRKSDSLIFGYPDEEDAEPQGAGQ